MKTKKVKRKARKPRTRLTHVSLNLDKTQAAYVAEVAEYACVKVPVVLQVLMGTAIYKARRYELPESQELQKLRDQLRLARKCMEVNDPGNARDIFGPPLDEKPAEPEGAPHADP